MRDGGAILRRPHSRMGPMNLDVNTLFLVTIYVEAILGLLLLFAWIQNPHIRAVAWWGCAHLVRAGSVVLFGMYGSVSRGDLDRSRQRAAVHGLRGHLDRRARVRRPAGAADVLVRGPVVWLLVCRICRASADSIKRAILLASGIITTYTWLTAYEFWRGRSEPWCRAGPRSSCCSRTARCSCCARRWSPMLPWSPTDQVFDSVWLTVLSFEALLFTIAIAFILLAMAKERTEFRHRTAAMVDPLTGSPTAARFCRTATS